MSSCSDLQNYGSRCNGQLGDELNEELQRDLLAADLRLSLFAGAVQSFKYESLLKPVPASFKNSHSGEVDIDRLRQLVSRLPPLPFDFSDLDNDATQLLKAVLQNNSYRLTTITQKQLKEVVLGELNFQTTPHWIFRIDHSALRNESWERRKLNASTFYAFHGSRFENFHSILNLGLHQHLNKNSLFGEGIYLSTEQSLSLHYSPCGQGWSKSKLGTELSILALCEVIDHPDVKRQSSRSRNSSVPDKYILVTNNELVRPRYLLVYAMPKVSANRITKVCQEVWLKHKFLILLGFYASLLLAIGLAKKVI